MVSPGDGGWGVGFGAGPWYGLHLRATGHHEVTMDWETKTGRVLRNGVWVLSPPMLSIGMPVRVGGGSTIF